MYKIVPMIMIMMTICIPFLFLISITDYQASF